MKLRHNMKLFLGEMKASTGKDVAEHVIRLANVIPASLVIVSYTQLLISILRLQMYLMRMKQWLDEEAGGRETDSIINVSSDWVNRIDCIPHIYWVQMLVCKIHNIVMNFRSAKVWADQSNIPRSLWTRSLRMKTRLTMVRRRFRSNWMARSTFIQIIPVPYWILFWT